MTTQNVNTRKKTILTDYRLPHPISDEPVNGSKYPAQLMFDQKINGTITLKVNDGIYKEGSRSNHKEVDMDYMHRGVLFHALLEACSDKDFKTKQIPIKWRSFVFTGGQNKLSDEPIVQVIFTIIRDDNGVIALGWSKGDYKVKFTFNGPKATEIVSKNSNGERVTENGLLSRLHVKAWVEFHNKVVTDMEVEGWTPPKPKVNNTYSKPNNNDVEDTDYDDPEF